MMYLGLILLAFAVMMIGSVPLIIGSVNDTEYLGPGILTIGGIGITIVGSIILLIGFILGAIKYLG